VGSEDALYESGCEGEDEGKSAKTKAL
jgi:hypothetical protein